MSSHEPQKVRLTTALKSNQVDKGKIRGSKTQYYHFEPYIEEFEAIQ
jgi:hypothetical protein